MNTSNPPTENQDFPRRNRVDLWTSSEKAIFDAKQHVEMMGAHPLLTEAVNCLSEAQNKVADYVDSLQNLQTT